MFFFTLLAFAILLYVLCYVLWPMMQGAVYFPTTEEHVKIMLGFVGADVGKKVVDLGSGDGRVLIALAKAGYEAYGFEIDPLLVRTSRRLIREAGIESKAKVIRKSFWKQDLASFDVVIVYGIPHIMKRLQKKLARELTPGARVISNRFVFPDWEVSEEREKVSLYIFPPKAKV